MIHETFLHAVNARLQVLDRDNDRSIYDETLPIAADTTQVTFEAKLPAGPTKMMAWFIDEQGKQCGAYYVYATRIDEQP